MIKVSRNPWGNAAFIGHEVRIPDHLLHRDTRHGGGDFRRGLEGDMGGFLLWAMANTDEEGRGILHTLSLIQTFYDFTVDTMVDIRTRTVVVGLSVRAWQWDEAMRSLVPKPVTTPQSPSTFRHRVIRARGLR